MVNKFIAAMLGAAAIIVTQFVAPEDQGQAQEIITAAEALLTAIGVYLVPNRPAGRPL